MATTITAAAVLILMTTSFAGGLSPAPPSAPIPTVLSSLGFHGLAVAAAAANLSAAIPTTIFAPTDSSLLTCPSCSLPLLVQEHAIPGLYPLQFLRKLSFGTKLLSFGPYRCVTITTAAEPATRTVFVNGVEIARPDLYDDGVLVIHALQGFVTHLSPQSCVVEAMASLSFPQTASPVPALLLRRLMLKEAMAQLRTTGYSIAALAMRIRYPELADLDHLTLFAVDDESIFLRGGGAAYVAEVGFHTVPGLLLEEDDLKALRRGDALPTMKAGRSLVVTSGDDSGGVLTPMRINYVKVKTFGVVRNGRIVVHGLSTPFQEFGPYGQIKFIRNRS